MVHGILGYGVFTYSSAADGTVAITLTIISLFLIFTTHLQTFTRNVESSMEIAVLVDFDYESEEQEKKIEESIKAIDGVSSVKYSSKEDEFNYYIEQYDDEDRGDPLGCLGHGLPPEAGAYAVAITILNSMIRALAARREAILCRWRMTTCRRI